MHRTGHYGAALCLYAPVGFLALAAGFAELAVAGGVVAVGGATVPDLDLRVPFLPHRGPTHTVWFAAAVAAACALGGGALGAGSGALAAVGVGAFAALAGAVAIGSHLLADAMTPMGIRPFAPLRDDRYSLEAARAANPIANYGLLALGVLLTAAAAAGGSAVAGAVG
ncbi:hypothetical protein GCM10027435_04040 [Haloparvum alkalitolerans]|uniref:metal-dependent hydrolase n=1 Tax=Haloparvum alkalitolerans TaxID=1042953 RepID=UPI003CEA3247